VSDLVSRLGSSAQLEELNLSWCSLTISTPLRRLLSVPTLTMLDLSNNRLYFLELQKSSEFIQPRQFMKDMRIAGILIEEELANGMADLFPGPLLDKGGKTIDIIKIVDMITRLWPWKKLPPTPPEVIPEPDITAKQKEKPKKGK
ncbi:unnamed protein product, partial [Leptidea sinapis]